MEKCLIELFRYTESLRNSGRIQTLGSARCLLCVCVRACDLIRDDLPKEIACSNISVLNCFPFRNFDDKHLSLFLILSLSLSLSLSQFTDLWQPLRVTWMSGDDFLESLEAVVDSWLVQS